MLMLRLMTSTTTMTLTKKGFSFAMLCFSLEHHQGRFRNSSASKQQSVGHFLHCVCVLFTCLFVCLFVCLFFFCLFSLFVCLFFVCLFASHSSIALFDMPNSYRFNILSISIFSEISLSISIFSKISLSISIFSRTALSISIFFRIALSISQSQRISEHTHFD